jgi:hypothetical protein
LEPSPISGGDNAPVTTIRDTPPPPAWGVVIDRNAIARLAVAWARRRFDAPRFDYRGLPSWQGPRWYNFCVLACSVVACLWPEEGETGWQVEVDGGWLDDAPGLFGCFTRAGASDPRAFLSFDLAAAERFFAGRGRLQLLAERAQRLREVADALVNHYQGSAARLVEEAGFDGPRIVDLLVRTVPGYRDEPPSDHGPLPFNKLAYLCTALMNSRSQHPFTGLETFPVYPDYMLPRFLRHHRVLEYEPALAQAVDHRLLIPAGSPWELAIRWATVYAADRLVARLHELGNRVTVPALDYAMWEAAVLGPEAAEMGEHHRTVTLAY